MGSPSSSAHSFSAEMHSWIMLDAAEALLPPSPGSMLPGFSEAAAAAAAEATAATEEDASTTPPLQCSLPASPNMLRETGDIVAALAVSEILSAEAQWPLPASQASPPLPALASGDASYDEPGPSIPSPQARAEARKLGALAYPPPGQSGKEAFEGKGAARNVSGLYGAASCISEEDQSEADAFDDLFDPLMCWSGAWARPLAYVAVLLASHAACVLIGVALGKAQIGAGKAAGAPPDGVLVRRFSSSTMPTTRMCMA